LPSSPSAHIDRFPFLEYAIYFWGCHARGNADQDIEELTIVLLLDQGKLHSISRNLLSVPWYPSRYGRSNRLRINLGSPWIDKTLSKDFTPSMEFPGIHTIAYFGLDEIYEALIKKLDSFDLNRTIFGTTPLLIAAQRGHHVVVRQLIEAEGIDIEAQDRDKKHRYVMQRNGGKKLLSVFCLRRGLKLIRQIIC
jgi:hypothetical protein